MTTHVQILERNGKKEFAILPYEEFIRIQEALENYEELRALRIAKTKERNLKTVSLKKAREILRLN